MVEDLEQITKDLERHVKLAEDRLNQLKYLQADFENYRKWSEKEKASVIALANESLIKDLLVILDDFDQAIPSLEKEENREGLLMIRKKMMKILGEYGLQPIECVGKKFDPHFHEVISKEKCQQESDTILKDFSTGYQLKSKVIRPSKVKIAEQIAENVGDNYGKREDYWD
ncbi:nucleotide exchange factor GrpE [Methanospirillum lacunae]|uniref:Protein GrpE n=1 Tax=Methanospirillum lacunae TaxID=668570 RepID=A0A2V2NBJ5_9EURY|nr:nucleotide exchange factor GrpE [Methanospirillum lacunae]PWR73717.1 nucleotide exchange factor GrpE [Methanospirillum lacunae]